MPAPFRLLLAAACALAPYALTAPALATAADPGRSVVTVQAPALAPGALGTAPLYGELRSNGAFVLHATASQARTGNAVQDTLIRQFVPGTLSLSADSPRRMRQLRDGQTMQMTGTVFVAGSSVRVPLFVRMTRLNGQVALRTFFKLPLAPYGVRRPGGGHPGDVRVAIWAVFAN